MRTATIFIDESGSVASGRFWGMGAVRVRRPDVLQDNVHKIRQKTGFPADRFHFQKLTRSQRYVYRELAQAAVNQTDLQYSGLWVDKLVADPRASNERGDWEVKASMVAILLTKSIKPREQVTVLLDRMPPPPQGTFEQVVIGKVRRALGKQPMTTLLQLDSKSCDGLQVADLFTSAMMHGARQRYNEASKVNAKADLVADLCAMWNVESLSEAKTKRLHVERYRSRRQITGQGELLA